MSIERTIQKAKIRETGKVIKDLNKYFNNRKNSFTIRQEHNRDNISFQCLSCEQPLVIAQSKKNNIYLKHLPKSNYCELKDENLSNKELDIFNNILASKESKRHIYLKNRVGELLKKENNISDVRIDDHFIFNNSGKKRRPDIYFKYFEKEIVFEIQLSQLSQKYILGRYDFYKEKGIYLVWILDTIDISVNNSAMGLDIKYLSNHQNYFKFEDKTDRFKLRCDYKYSFLFGWNNELRCAWNTVSINIEKLKFDSTNIEVYFHHFQNDKEQKERNQIRIQKELSEKEKEEEEEELANEIQDFLDKIGYEKSKKYKSDFSRLKFDLNSFSKEKLDLLNSRLNLEKNQKIFYWIKKGVNADYNFIEFIINNNCISLDLNQVDNLGYNLFYYLYNNKSIYQKEKFLILFFKRDYKFVEVDIKTLKNHSIDSYSESEMLFKKANTTPNWLIDSLFEYRNRRVICIIESFLWHNLIGYYYKENKWLNLAQNAIQNYPEYWEYIERAIKASGLFEDILQSDKSSKFYKKLEKINIKEFETDFNFNQLFMHHYPELLAI
ncbi:DUF6035 family protein [Mesonia sp. K7]|uniref:DUF6035 family protein n=1 Tax=Mesonia sp. K7 TaxID=2218606 RepID=UPI000DAAB4F0|nr:DUF6035 family protein [Mesonia sp. K7]PZD79161.1 hypothetical protein DNG35_03910 [Mesonia sp. K7]